MYQYMSASQSSPHETLKALIESLNSSYNAMCLSYLIEINDNVLFFLQAHL